MPRRSNLWFLAAALLLLLVGSQALAGQSLGRDEVNLSKLFRESDRIFEDTSRRASFDERFAINLQQKFYAMETTAARLKKEACLTLRQILLDQLQLAESLIDDPDHSLTGYFNAARQTLSQEDFCRPKFGHTSKTSLYPDLPELQKIIARSGLRPNFQTILLQSRAAFDELRLAVDAVVHAVSAEAASAPLRTAADQLLDRYRKISPWINAPFLQDLAATAQALAQTPPAQIMEQYPPCFAAGGYCLGRDACAETTLCLVTNIGGRQRILQRLQSLDSTRR